MLPLHDSAPIATEHQAIVSITVHLKQARGVEKAFLSSSRVSDVADAVHGGLAKALLEKVGGFSEGRCGGDTTVHT